jgi:hypothetical protein
MNDNIPSLPKVTIAAAGARLRELAPHIMNLQDALMAPSAYAPAREEARRSLAVLDMEDGALRTYVTGTPARNAEEALVQIDAVALLAEAMASDDDFPDDYRELAGRLFRVLASVAGVLSDVAGRGLDEFTTSNLDETYSVAFPLAARSAFFAAELGH